MLLKPSSAGFAACFSFGLFLKAAWASPFNRWCKLIRHPLFQANLFKLPAKRAPPVLQDNIGGLNRSPFGIGLLKTDLDCVILSGGRKIETPISDVVRLHRK